MSASEILIDIEQHLSMFFHRDEFVQFWVQLGVHLKKQVVWKTNANTTKITDVQFEEQQLLGSTGVYAANVS